MIAVLAAVLAYGGVVHIVQLATGGWPPYRWAPVWLSAYYTSLTVFDPLAAWLLIRRRTPGLYLAAGVLVTDAAANWYATYCLTRTSGVARAAQFVISLVAVASLLMVHNARPWFALPRDRT